VRPLAALGGTQLAVALVVVASTSLFDEFPRLFLDLSTRWGGSFAGFLAASFALAAIGLLPTTILLGMGLPLVLGEAARTSRGLAHEVGALYSVNTWAGIAGSVLAGFVLVPLVGIRAGILVLAGANALTGLLALASARAGDAPRAGSGARESRTLRLGLAAAAAFLLLAFLLPPWDPEAMTSGLHTSGRAGDSAGAAERLVYYEEGVAATVSVKQRGRDLKLQVNGRTEATSVGDLKTNTLLGSLPILLRPNAGSALVIGLGSGVTLAGVTPHPLASIECVELCAEVVEASRLFGKVAGDATRDPRVALRAEDGRNHLLLTRRRYDVIISQPSNLWAAGVGNLFTHEFFELCRDRLAEDGILCQWIQGYSVSKSSLRSILHTLSEVFPTVDVWIGEWSDLLVTASMGDAPISVAALERAFADPSVGASLRRAGVPDAATLLSHHRMDAGAVKRYSRGARLHTDDNRLVEFGEPKSLAEGTASSQSLDLLAWETDVLARLVDVPEDEAGAARTVGRLANAVAARRLEVEGRSLEAAGQGSPAIETLRRAVSLHPEDTAIRRNLARLLVRKGVELAHRSDYSGAQGCFAEAVHADGESPEAAGNTGLLAMLGGADAEAMRWTNRAIELDPENETYFAQRAEIHRRAARFAEARDDAQRALALFPDHLPSILLLAESLAFLNDPEGADRELQRARRLGAPHEELARIKSLVRQDG
jgi:spermidine synthase